MNTDIEVARIQSKGRIIAALIGGAVGLLIAFIAQSDRFFELFSGDLPPSVCTTEDGEIGRVRLTTKIFNSDDTPHGHDEEHASSAPGIFVISDRDVWDIEANTSDFKNKRWAATWTCIK